MKPRNVQGGSMAASARRVRGFTLIELMITVVVIGILAAVAYPSYLDYVRRGNRSAAQTFMMTIAQRQEQYLTSNRSYAEDTGTPATCTCSPVPCTCTSKLSLMWPPETVGKYTFGVTGTANAAGTIISYTVTATPQGTQSVAGKFGTLTLSNDGTKGVDAAEWQR